MTNEALEALITAILEIDNVENAKNNVENHMLVQWFLNHAERKEAMQPFYDALAKEAMVQGRSSRDVLIQGVRQQGLVMLHAALIQMENDASLTADEFYYEKNKRSCQNAIQKFFKHYQAFNTALDNISEGVDPASYLKTFILKGLCEEIKAYRKELELLYQNTETVLQNLQGYETGANWEYSPVNVTKLIDLEGVKYQLEEVKYRLEDMAPVRCKSLSNTNDINENEGSRSIVLVKGPKKIDYRIYNGYNGENSLVGKGAVVISFSSGMNIEINKESISAKDLKNQFKDFKKPAHGSAEIEKYDVAEMAHARIMKLSNDNLSDDNLMMTACCGALVALGRGCKVIVDSNNAKDKDKVFFLYLSAMIIYHDKQDKLPEINDENFLSIMADIYETGFIQRNNNWFGVNTIDKDAFTPEFIKYLEGSHNRCRGVIEAEQRLPDLIELEVPKVNKRSLVVFSMFAAGLIAVGCIAGDAATEQSEHFDFLNEKIMGDACSVGVLAIAASVALSMVVFGLYYRHLKQQADAEIEGPGYQRPSMK